ncbi:hypothetical protein ACE3MZ_19490 [Paenibacillus sp. WLX1005]|uniref:hypothetical protein n=1 Tax=Paenibacillus sp. WLX1005 TaxID=3243766 RepID=UPI0039845729
MIRKTLRLFPILIFLFPAILLSFFVWNEYTDSLNLVTSSQYSNEISNIFYVDQGHRVVALSPSTSDNQLNAYLYQADGSQYEGEVSMDSNIFMEHLAAYYKDQLLLTVKDQENDAHAYMLDTATKQLTNLINQPLSITSYLSSDSYMWRNQIIFAQADQSGQYDAFIARIANGKFQYINLQDGSYFKGQRPISIDAVSDTFDDAGGTIPMFTVSLADSTTAYISGILDDKGNIDVYYHPEKQDNTFEAEDLAQLQFRKHFGTQSRPVIKINSTYPVQAYTYSQDDDALAVVPTPKPVYDAQLFLLNDNEILLAGSTTPDPVKGKRRGYVYNEQTKQSIDVSALLANLSVEDFNNNQLRFYKESGSPLIYYSYEEHGGGWLNTDTKKTASLQTDAVRRWQLNGQTGALSNSPSVHGFLAFVGQGGALVINWLIWLAIPVLMILVPLLLIPLLRYRKKRQLSRGIVVDAVITGMKETGTRINEQPLVDFTIAFHMEGQPRELHICKVISLLNAPSIGDTVMISYDPARNKAIFVSENDDVPLPQEAPEPELIQNATLQRIDRIDSVQRAEALVLHFEAGGQHYDIPVVQSVGFTYRIGEQATLAVIAGTPRLFRYGASQPYRPEDHLTLQGELIYSKPYPIRSEDRQLVLMEISIQAGEQVIRRMNSLFVQDAVLRAMRIGMTVPVSVNRYELEREIRLLRGKQGSAIVQQVEFQGTIGERPLAKITVQRDGRHYVIEQSIEPLFGVQIGDELWIAYDEQLQEAIIVKYAHS